ncbi:MAG: DUF1570 domain-containing protein [Planctomycetaceae bacterium]
MTHLIHRLLTTRLFSSLSALVVGANCMAGSPLLELTTKEQVFVGKSLAHDQQVCWLAREDGQISEISLRDVTSFRKVNDEFRGLSAVEIRNQLRHEFGHSWEIVSTSHYLVCTPKGRAKPFADLFEGVYRSLRGYVSVRGFELPPPDFPLIAVVYPTEKDFALNCRNDGVPYMPGLRGYYHRRTNRVCLFEDDSDHLAIMRPSCPSTFNTAAVFPNVLRYQTDWAANLSSSFSNDRSDANIQSTLRDTIVHEATHQAAYNLGLHTRIGFNPKWVTEGLATLLEPDGMRENRRGQTPQKRLNQERFEWFVEFAQQERQPKSLADFIADDRMFQTAPLNGYAQAWALSFYLAETRSSQYWQYLQTISKRDPLDSYRAEDRLADFQNAFGEDIDRLEVAFLRFIDDLQ